MCSNNCPVPFITECFTNDLHGASLFLAIKLLPILAEYLYISPSSSSSVYFLQKKESKTLTMTAKCDLWSFCSCWLVRVASVSLQWARSLLFLARVVCASVCRFGWVFIKITFFVFQKFIHIFSTLKSRASFLSFSAGARFTYVRMTSFSIWFVCWLKLHCETVFFSAGVCATH